MIRKDQRQAQRRQTARAVWGIPLLLLALTACMPAKIQALEEYSRQCKQLLTPKLERYAEQFRKSSRATSRQALQTALKERVLPALEAYVTALQQIRPTPKKLKQIHGHLTAGYTRWLAQLNTFAKGLNTDAMWIKRAAQLQTQVAALTDVEQAYHRAIKAYARPPKRRR